MITHKARVVGVGLLGLGTAGYGYDRMFTPAMRRYSHFDRKFGAI